MNKIERKLWTYFIGIESNSEALNFAKLCEHLGFDTLFHQMIEQLNDQKESRKQTIMEKARENF